MPVQMKYYRVFNSRAKLQAWLSKLGNLRLAMSRDWYAEWLPQETRAKIVSLLEQVRTEVQHNMPYTMCRCRPLSDCEDCNGKRWISRKEYREQINRDAGRNGD